MIVIVTGVSGFIGSRLAQALLDGGHKVIGTVNRSTPRLGPHPNFSVRKVNLEDGAALQDLVEEAHAQDPELVVAHIAALVSDWGPEEAFERANVLSLEHLIESLKLIHSRSPGPDSPWPILIHTSSLSVHGFSIHHRNTTEEGPYAELVSAYQRSKKQSEMLVKRAAEEGLRCLCLRPANIYGPGDSTTLYPLLDAVREGSMAYLNKGRHLTCPLHVDDMVAAYLLSIETLKASNWKKAQGRTINISSGEEISWKRFLEAASSAAGLRAPKASYPAWVGYLGAAILSGLHRLLRKDGAPLLTRYRIQQVAHDYHFAPDLARETIGFEARIGLEEGLDGACRQWRIDRGLEEA